MKPPVLVLVAILLPVLVYCQQAELVPNGGFENGQTGWQFAVAPADAGRVAIVTTDPHSGTHALSMDATQLGHEVGAMSGLMPVQAGKPYRFTVWVKQTAGYGLYKATINWLDAADKHISYANDWAGSNCPTEYAPHGGVFVAPPGATHVALLFGIAPGSACLMDDISLVQVEPGPAELRAYLFSGPPDAEGSAIVRARVQNLGQSPSAPGQASLEVGQGLKVENAEQPLPALQPGEHAGLSWTIAGAGEASVPLKLRVVAGDAKPVEVASRTAGPAAKIVQADGKGVPPPHPARTDLLVGTYYFPVMLDWDRSDWGVRHVDYLHPTLGYYNEASPAVADWHIKWAVEHGISFFAFDWYYNDGSLYINDALEKGLLKSRYLSQIKFCINWCNEGQCTWDRPLNFSTESLKGFMTYLCEHYLGLPEYLRVDGKPVVMIIRPDPIIEAHGGPDGSRKALNELRAVARKYGHPDLYLMCIGAAERSAFYKRAGYDAITVYDYGFAGAPAYPNGDREYEDLVSEHERAWHDGLRDARGGGLAYMPALWTGWDDNARAHERAVRTRNNTADRFRTMCQIGKQYVDPKLNLLIVEAWNEWGEGGYLEPSKERGFAFLDAMRDVFARQSGPHTDVVPTPEQVAGYDTKLTFSDIDTDYILRDRAKHGIRPVTALDWSFDTDGDPKGWGNAGNVTAPVVTGGAWSARSFTDDPMIIGPGLMAVDAAKYPALEVRMRVDGGKMGQVFWRLDGMGNFTEEASCKFPLITDGQFHVYRVPLADNAQWRGTIRQLRFDPTDAEGVSIAVDYIKGVR
jgi:hypothetical protein